MVRVGQGVLGRIRFQDGIFPEYLRTFLVVFVSTEQIGLINVSSVAGKEHKLLYPANKYLIKYNPPFKKESFVKLDSLTYISVSETTNLKTLCHGACLDTEELSKIINLLEFRR